VGSVLGNQVTWTATSTGGNAPYGFLWSGDSKVVGSTSTSIVATYTANGTYVANIQATDASSTIATSTCSATVSSIITPTPTTTPVVLLRVNQPTLSIGSNGSFLAHGMTVTSVASGSFMGTVWGVTYTVNLSGPANTLPEFYLRNGNKATTTASGQLAIGDEVGVSGRVSSSSPLTVTGNVVRDYSIIQPRPGMREGQPTSPFYNGQGNGGENRGGNVSPTASSSSQNDIKSRIDDLMNQLKNIQGLMHGNATK
jgi:hypothetical protein